MSTATAFAPAWNSADALIDAHAPLVRRIAFHLVSRLPPNVQVDDLIQAGMLGLLEAAKNFLPGRGARFETFAGIRIRGAMLDEIRKSDWAPRSLHRTMRRAARAARDIEAAKARPAREVEIAERLGMDIASYRRVLQEAASQNISSLDELWARGDGCSAGFCTTQPGPADQVDDAQRRQLLADCLTALPDRERLVLSLYYDQGLNLREIGALLEVSESRVCQIHGQAVAHLRSRAASWQKRICPAA